MTATFELPFADVPPDERTVEQWDAILAVYGDRTVAYRRHVAATSYPVAVHYGHYVREQVDGDACAVCFRGFERGEKTEPYAAPDSDAPLYRHAVCPDGGAR